LIISLKPSACALLHSMLQGLKCSDVRRAFAAPKPPSEVRGLGHQEPAAAAAVPRVKLVLLGDSVSKANGMHHALNVFVCPMLLRHMSTSCVVFRVLANLVWYFAMYEVSLTQPAR